MGYYTEIIFGATLKKSTPKNIIDTLRYVANSGNEDEIKTLRNIESEDPIVAVDHELIDKYDLWAVMKSCSYYFGVSSPVSKMWYDKIGKEWVLSFRANCKNGDRRLERFTDWILPYIDSGMGGYDIYSIICTEDGEPIFYGKYGAFTTLKVNKDDLR